MVRKEMNVLGLSEGMIEMRWQNDDHVLRKESLWTRWFSNYVR